MRKESELQICENLEVIDIGDNNKGIAKQDGRVFFITDTVPGDLVDVKIFRNKHHRFEATPVKFHHYSEKRTAPFCSHFGSCGGCKLQHIKYEAQLELKQKMVVDALNRIGKIKDFTLNNILASSQTQYYKNKLEFSFSDCRWLTEEEIKSGIEFIDRNALGFHYPGKFNKIVHIDKCWLQADPSNQIRNFIYHYAIKNHLSFYNIDKQEGFLRALFIKVSSVGEVMIILVVGESNDSIHQVLKEVIHQFPALTSVYYMINTKKNESLYDLEPVLFSGKAFILEKLGDINIQIGPKSFYQTNSLQATRLYEIVKDFAGNIENDVVYDLYCGVGSIGLILANKAKKVIGIETVAESVLEAEQNKNINGIENIYFFQGMAEKILQPDFFNINGIPDLVILDPPRPGIHNKLVDTLLEILPGRIIYVSCNPATQARDLNLLSEHYTVDSIQPVDMFPHTSHVENVALLIKKDFSR